MNKSKSKSKCCEKCHAIIKAFPSSPDCDDTSCECHTPMPNKSKGKKEIELIKPNDLANWYKEHEKLQEQSSFSVGDCNKYVAKKINEKINASI